MPSKNLRRADAPTPPVGRLKPLRLRAVASQPAAIQAARRPLVPTHAAGLTNHARQHVPRAAQS